MSLCNQKISKRWLDLSSKTLIFLNFRKLCTSFEICNQKVYSCKNAQNSEVNTWLSVPGDPKILKVHYSIIKQTLTTSLQSIKNLHQAKMAPPAKPGGKTAIVPSRKEEVVPMTKKEKLKYGCFVTMVLLLWVSLAGVSLWSLDLARQSIKIVKDVP